VIRDGIVFDRVYFPFEIGEAFHRRESELEIDADQGRGRVEELEMEIRVRLVAAAAGLSTPAPGEGFRRRTEGRCEGEQREAIRGDFGRFRRSPKPTATMVYQWRLGDDGLSCYVARLVGCSGG
jgi:hypothetical protein